MPDFAQMTDIDTLPPDLSRFIGRARELREIAVLVAPGRLVTLLGPGWVRQDTSRSARGDRTLARGPEDRS
ncbi:hypothetical protein CJ177_35500 [Rhodococcus sp. ACPA1]|nr:hypothetical protein CJ177_35500 [Rhodococcus sp. ACPA1]